MRDGAAHGRAVAFHHGWLPVMMQQQMQRRAREAQQAPMRTRSGPHSRLSLRPDAATTAEPLPTMFHRSRPAGDAGMAQPQQQPRQPGAKYEGDAARYPLHAAAEEGRLADLAAGIRAKEAEGSLAAGEPHPLRMLSRVALPHP